jgi:Zn-finger nucleic acid-binding protein
MICPSCNNDLMKIPVATDSGSRFDVDHCGRCGGTWFEPYEINRIPYHEVVRIAHLTVWKQKQHLPDHPMHCPHDNHLLEQFHSDSLPAGVHFLRCKFCFGLWATQHSLEVFKKEQEEKVRGEEKPKPRDSVFPALSTILVPLVLIILLFVSTFLTITSLQSQRDLRAAAQSFIQNIQTTAQGSNEIITFETTKDLSSQITYGETFLSQDTKWVSVAPVFNHSIMLTDLKPNTTYSYTITLEDTQNIRYTTPEKTFSTEE